MSTLGPLAVRAGASRYERLDGAATTRPLGVPFSERAGWVALERVLGPAGTVVGGVTFMPFMGVGLSSGGSPLTAWALGSALPSVPIGGMTQARSKPYHRRPIRVGRDIAVRPRTWSLVGSPYRPDNQRRARWPTAPGHSQRCRYCREEQEHRQPSPPKSQTTIRARSSLDPPTGVDNPIGRSGLAGTARRNARSFRDQ